jgi:hypothetical protein
LSRDRRLPGTAGKKEILLTSRRIELHRDQDVTGVSGIGRVAEGVVFENGHVVLRWLGELTSTVHHSSVENVRRIHGHDGRTRVVWID